jgi:hypothetical protein
MAEYRAFQLLLQRSNPTPRDGRFRWIEITRLSPRHYQAYAGGPRSVRVRVLRSWHCPGNTAHFRRVCPGPYEPNEVPEALYKDRSLAFEDIPELIEEFLAKRAAEEQRIQP